MKPIYFSIFALVIAIHAPPAFADDVTDQIKEAVAAYEKKDLNTAAIALNAASKLILQQQAEVLAKLLPEALSGWKARKSDSAAAGAAMFGGGIQAERRYTKDRMRVTVSITGNSPMLQAMSMMFSNPMYQGGRNKLVIMDGQKVLRNERENSLQTMVGNKYLIAVKGSRRTDEDEVTAYFKAMNFDALKKMAAQ